MIIYIYFVLWLLLYILYNYAKREVNIREDIDTKQYICKKIKEQV